MRIRYSSVLMLALLLAPAAFAQQFTDEAQAHLQRNAFRYDLTAGDLADLAVTDAYASRRSGTTHVYLRQTHDGIPVAGAEFTVALDANGRVLHAAGRGAALAGRALATAPSLQAEAAVTALARDAGLTPTEPFRVLSSEPARDGASTPQLTLSDGGVAMDPVVARLVYRLADDGTVTLAWEVGLYELSAQHYWFGYVDAQSGRVLERYDHVVHDSFGPAAEAEAAPVNLAPLAPAAAASRFAPAALAGSYRVYAPPVESPYFSVPATPGDGRTLETNSADPTASPFGWHDTDGDADPDYTITRGNNVNAYTDVNADNTPDAGSQPDGGAGLVFDFPVDFTQPPSAYRPAAVTNLFYWSNIIHDVFWQYGFDEAAGNFQETNYSGDGFGNDAVLAEAQDGSGVNNANFYTPPDGGCDVLGCFPRMQMYVGTGANPDTDGDLDNLVISHEYGHGISNRLTGGPTNVHCLDNAEQMGEGWSDWFGNMLTMETGDQGTDSRGVGTYLFGQGPNGPGIREAPYSTDFAINDYTYGDTRFMFGAHSIGFVWATVLWEVTWEVIDVYGFDPDIYNAAGTAGNQIMMNLVMEGLRLQPCSPGFVTGRDAILAADQALYGGEHLDLLWAGFARRGLGVNASQGSSGSNSDNVEDFTEPETVAPAPVTDLAATADPLGVALTWTATGDDGTTGTATSYDLRYTTDGPITTDAAFNTATQVSGEPTPQPSGSSEAFTVTGLDYGTTYYFALKVSDNSFNTSDLSNSPEATTLGAPEAVLSTDPIEAAARPDEQATVTFSIGNTGESALSYAINLSETTTALQSPASPAARGGQPSTAHPAARSETKGAPEASGTSPAFGEGGPDAFGYEWIDSDEPGGPAYDWVDISGSGTAVPFLTSSCGFDPADEGYADLTLPFAFPFYGTNYNTVRVYPNGNLSFNTTSTDCTYSNDPIPSSDYPNNLIAGFWTDLDGSSGGSVQYQDMGDGRFIVQWTDVPPCCSAGPGYTFQIILSGSGAILYQYEQMDADLTSATIGVENADGSDGLQVVFNAAYVHDGLAVRISSLWMSADPAAGTVGPGATEDVTLTFDAGGLAEGTYTADMTVTTNDPATPSVVIPVTFTVSTTVANEGGAGDDPLMDFPGTHLLSEVYPNPFNGRAQLSLAVAEAQTVRVELFDALGRRVALLHDGPMAARTLERITLDGTRLASGTYVIRVAGETFAEARRVTLLH